MSSAPLWRARALGLAFAIALLALSVVVMPTRGVPNPIEPAAAMTVTVALDKSSYLSGDTASATAIVYRTPSPGNYTYTWRVRDFFFRLLNTTVNGPATFRYPIPLDYTGTLRFEATVDDGQGLVVAGQSSATVSLAFMSLSLDRGDYNPGDTIRASYGVTSHVILRPTYTYEVDDATPTVVSSGTTNETFFSFVTPNPASRFYTFRVTATDGGNSTQALATIAQASGVILGVTFDRPSYVAGDSLHAHLTLTARGTTALPSQFRWFLSMGSVFASAISTSPDADLSLTVPQGTGNGGVVVFASEANTGAFASVSVQVGTPSNAFWSTEIGGVPAFALVLGLLFIILLVAVAALWMRVGGFGILGRKGTPPPPPEGPVRAPPSTPMSVSCGRCGKPIELTTSRRPIEVMCPSCGETQVVT